MGQIHSYNDNKSIKVGASHKGFRLCDCPVMSRLYDLLWEIYITIHMK